MNRPIASLPFISRCRRQNDGNKLSNVWIHDHHDKKPLNLKLPVPLRSRKHFAVKESMQQLIVQFIGNRKIRTRWNATKVHCSCSASALQEPRRGWAAFSDGLIFFFFYFGYPDLSLNTQTRFSNLTILNSHKQNRQTLSCSCCQ